MNTTERSMLLVKPDGVKQDLVAEIRAIILTRGLIITKEVRKMISQQTVIDLYENIGNIAQRDYFPELVKFMASSSIHVFVVEGADAVKKVREIIGKRDPASGIRAKWAKSIIENVAHGPHSSEEAKREIGLILGDTSMKKTTLQRVFIIGGMSESGKSSLGRYLDSKGISRLKIVTFLKKVMEKEGATGDFYAWNDRAQSERPEWLIQRFIAEFVNWTEENGIQNCCLESLYGPDLGVKLREALSLGVGVIVYVEIPIQIRLQRQVIRENLSSLAEAEKLLLPRDEKKAAWKVPEIKEVADEVIDNSGTIDELYLAAEALIAKYINN